MWPSSSKMQQQRKASSTKQFIRCVSANVMSAIIVAVLLIACSCVVQGQASVTGQFSAQQSWPYKGVHLHFLPKTGQVLFSASFSLGDIPQFWNPATAAITPATPASFNIFCGGHSFLPNGTILWAGGLGGCGSGCGVRNAAIFDPVANAWTELSNMNAGRWYPTNVTLANGDVLVISGQIDSTTGNDPLPEIWQQATGAWRDLTTAEVVLPVYPRMMLAPNGRVFLAGPYAQTKYLNTAGTGSWAFVAQTNFGSSRDYGPAVMYDVGKVLIAGGHNPPTKTAEVIDLNQSSPHWQYTGSMNYPRRQHNATILADGKVLVTGGSSGTGFDNSSLPVLPAEIWDPAMGRWTVVASLTVYRGYHSTAVLLPDARVLSAGGEVSATTAEVYSPPYLFQGTRPTIAAAPSTVTYGQKFFIATPDAPAITQVSWIGLSSVTHSFNMQQRFMRLTFTPGTSATGAAGLNVTAPANANIAPPGYYMVFILNNGRPSVAAIVHIG
ncbi:MAG: Kelch domain protein [Acidobacteriaceae bacterium]|nr:Kelch domain protein [Acidobacteriaceae bacterium]